MFCPRVIFILLMLRLTKKYRDYCVTFSATFIPQRTENDINKTCSIDNNWSSNLENKYAVEETFYLLRNQNTVEYIDHNDISSEFKEKWLLFQ